MLKDILCSEKSLVNTIPPRMLKAASVPCIAISTNSSSDKYPMKKKPFISDQQIKLFRVCKLSKHHTQIPGLSILVGSRVGMFCWTYSKYFRCISSLHGKKFLMILPGQICRVPVRHSSIPSPGLTVGYPCTRCEPYYLKTHKYYFIDVLLQSTTRNVPEGKNVWVFSTLRDKKYRNFAATYSKLKITSESAMTRLTISARVFWADV